MARVVFFLIGCLLTVTAVLKLWLLITDPFADVRVGLPKEMLWISVGFEVWLAYINFRVAENRLLLFADMVVFSVFGIFAIIRLSMGYTSCGCTGSIEVPPWLFPLLDAGIVLGLAIVSRKERPIASGIEQLIATWQRWSPEKRGRLVGLSMFLAIFTGIQTPVAAPLRAAVFGEPKIQISVRVADTLRVGEETSGEVEFWNRSSLPARVVGVSRSCRCFDFRNDANGLVLPPHSRISPDLVIQPRKSGPLHQRIEMFVDHPERFRVNVDVVGFVKGED